MTHDTDELVFVPLGGLGEIGMNAACYGFGPAGHRKWILVDCGLSFAGPEIPGIDLIMPDLTFIEKMKKDLLALIITHAHEDHIGAVGQLWPRLRCPVYATQFAADMLETRRQSDEAAPKKKQRAESSDFDSSEEQEETRRRRKKSACAQGGRGWRRN